jgi:hypothetical protein
MHSGDHRVQPGTKINILSQIFCLGDKMLPHLAPASHGQLNSKGIWEHEGARGDQWATAWPSSFTGNVPQLLGKLVEKSLRKGLNLLNTEVKVSLDE